MAQHKSVKKRIVKSKKENLRNRSYISMMKTAIKSVKNVSNKEEGENKLRKTVSILDKLVSKGIIHKNKAANEKSKLTKLVNSLS